MDSVEGQAVRKPEKKSQEKRSLATKGGNDEGSPRKKAAVKHPSKKESAKSSSPRRAINTKEENPADSSKNEKKSKEKRDKSTGGEEKDKKSPRKGVKSSPKIQTARASKETKKSR